MKKTFQLAIEGKNRDRLLDAVKHEIRKYLRRERRRVIPAGAHYWDFDCKFGLDADTAQVVHVATLTDLIDAVAKDTGPSFYLEILAKPGYRKPRPPLPEGAAPEPQQKTEPLAALASKTPSTTKLSSPP